MPDSALLKILKRLNDSYPYGIIESKFQQHLVDALLSGESVYTRLRVKLHLSEPDRKEIDAFLKYIVDEGLIKQRTSLLKKGPNKNLIVITEKGQELLYRFHTETWNRFGSIAIILLTVTLVGIDSGVVPKSENNAIVFFVLYAIILAWVYFKPVRYRSSAIDKYKYVITLKKVRK